MSYGCRQAVLSAEVAKAVQEASRRSPVKSLLWFSCEVLCYIDALLVMNGLLNSCYTFTTFYVQNHIIIMMDVMFLQQLTMKNSSSEL
jgi:hypothetical protein